MEDYKVKTGKRMQLIREERGKTQKEVAVFLSMTTPAYQNYEAGRREAGYETLSKLADFYNVSTDYLLGRDDIKPDPIELLNADEMEKRLVKSYFSVPPKLRAEFLKSMLQEYMKQEGIAQTTEEDNSE